MRSKLIALGILTFMSLNLFAQMNISTNMRQDGVWNKEEGKWDINSTDEDALTFFEFNKEFTMFKHTTSWITSAYLIKSSVFDEEKNKYELEVVSDVGNNYILIIDMEYNNLRFIIERDDDLLLVQHTIKKVWYDDE